MVVFTSGTIDCLPRLSRGCLFPCGGGWSGGGWGHTVGVLRHQRLLVVSVPGRISSRAESWGGAGVGLLFEIWIVDASIFVVCCRQRLVVRVCVRAAGVLCLPVIVGGCGVVLVVASCEGHMVDALASRADEGRRSLR
jgi:hypothetical protein